MKIPEFNLLDEKWIQVLKNDCSEELVSLPEVLIHAHEYRDLSGDTPEQDMAVLQIASGQYYILCFQVLSHDGQTDWIEFTSESQKKMESF